MKQKCKFIFALLALVALGGGVQVKAQKADMAMMVQRVSGGQDIIPIKSIGKITLANGLMQFTYTEGADNYPVSIPLNEITKCLFSNDYEPSGIVAPQVAKSTIALENDGEQLLIKGVEAETCSVAAYSIGGRCMMKNARFSTSQGISTSQWDAGLYIIIVNKTPFKYFKK